MRYTLDRLMKEGDSIFRIAGSSNSLSIVRERLFRRATRYQFDLYSLDYEPTVRNIVRVRDCVRTFRQILTPKSDKLAGFSVTQVLFDLAHGKKRPDLKPGFYAELIHMVMGMQGRGPGVAPADIPLPKARLPREAARIRSDELDKLWEHVEDWMSRYSHGLESRVQERRKKRRRKILSVLNGTEEDWGDWRWHIKHIVKDVKLLRKLVPLSEAEKDNIARACRAKLPFGVTPYYLSLMDANKRGGDRAIRAQVFPPANYVEVMAASRGNRDCAFDFMLERETSPIDLITRRYPGIVILKPYNTCPQICVYCQRNWEIDSAMLPRALATSKKIDRALAWIADHPAIHEVLLTGGDPLALNSRTINSILERLARIRSVEHIRIGSRTPVTIPMRITSDLIDILKKYIRPGRRDISLITHVEHPYEITPEMASAVRRLRIAGIPVYNQQVYTFYTSRRFESALLRKLLRKIGIEPYYVFNCKGKNETADYIVPIARLLQEVNEEARLLPGLTRTDEPVYNVPGLGKNYLRALQHHDLISVFPDGARVYEFHPWEPKAAGQKNYIGIDAPILSYLERLKGIGEKISDYATIWYYY
ncbi:MAG: KamA family radical SAM protein [Candidatus Zixiibacteriota bacterium]|nr:MAG: KamA family radical SAM protein [candidate division Zixibacteria bacterium]